MDFLETIAASDLKVSRCRQLIKFLKVCEYWRSRSFLYHIFSRFCMFCALVGKYIRWAFTGPLVLSSLLLLVRYLLNLHVMRTYTIFWLSSNFSQMGLLPVELAALEHLKSLKIYNGYQVSIVALWATCSILCQMCGSLLQFGGKRALLTNSMPCTWFVETWQCTYLHLFNLIRFKKSARQ